MVDRWASFQRNTGHIFANCWTTTAVVTGAGYRVLKTTFASRQKMCAQQHELQDLSGDQIWDWASASCLLCRTAAASWMCMFVISVIYGSLLTGSILGMCGCRPSCYAVMTRPYEGLWALEVWAAHICMSATVIDVFIAVPDFQILILQRVSQVQPRL